MATIGAWIAPHMGVEVSATGLLRRMTQTCREVGNLDTCMAIVQVYFNFVSLQSWRKGG
jgi:hypothetical protein